jgi:DNA transformation protein
MALSREFVDFLKDQMSGFGGVAIRKMFGGAGISLGGVNFAIVVDETLYLKTDALNAADFEVEGLENFSCEGKNGKRTAMSYRRAPARVMDDSEEMTLWCRSAYAAALRANQKNPPTNRTSRQALRRRR